MLTPNAYFDEQTNILVWADSTGIVHIAPVFLGDQTQMPAVKNVRNEREIARLREE